MTASRSPRQLKRWVCPDAYLAGQGEGIHMTAALPIPEAALAQHVAVLGKTGAGKSSVLRLIVEGLLDAGKPVCIVDPKGDWWGLKSSASGKRAGYSVIIFGGEHADVPINAHAGVHVAELV